MSAWLVYSMMGIYPLSPGEPKYAITTPLFDKITIQLDSTYYQKEKLVIEREKNGNGSISKILLNGKDYKNYFINHNELVNGNKLKIILK